METKSETVSENLTVTQGAAQVAATEETMTAQKKVSKRSKPKASKKARASKTTKPTKAPKAKREKPPKEDLVVFACRVAEAERVAFHEATGPGGASRFARRLMVVFANADESGFRALLKEARKVRD